MTEFLRKNCGIVIAQCGNYGNLLSHFLAKNFVKITFLLKKILKSWFDEFFDGWQFIFPHFVTWTFAALLWPLDLKKHWIFHHFSHDFYFRPSSFDLKIHLKIIWRISSLQWRRRFSCLLLFFRSFNLHIFTKNNFLVTSTHDSLQPQGLILAGKSTICRQVKPKALGFFCQNCEMHTFLDIWRSTRWSFWWLLVKFFRQIDFNFPKNFFNDVFSSWHDLCRLYLTHKSLLTRTSHFNVFSDKAYQCIGT